jgi:hypothetical protein
MHLRVRFCDVFHVPEYIRGICIFAKCLAQGRL